MKRRIGDRRVKPRFEIVGDLWGSVEISASLAVVNLGRGGALVESDSPLVAQSVHAVLVAGADESHQVTLRVRHSTPADGQGQRRYLTGVEFVEVTPALDEFLVRQIAFGTGSLPAEA
jgi:hypothetical protein